MQFSRLNSSKMEITSQGVMQFSRLNSSKMEITSQRLLDQSQAGVYMGKTPHTPPFGPIRVPYPKGLNC